MSIIRQETKDGVVVDCKNDFFVWVVLDKSCKPKEECHAGCGGCGGNKPALRKKVCMKRGQKFTIGQKITLKQHILNENIAAFIVFGIPVFMAMTSLVLWYLYTPQKVESPLALISTGLAFTTGFLFVWIIDTMFRKQFPSEIISSFPDNPGISTEQELIS